MNKTFTKTLAYSSFAISAALVIYAFLTAKTYIQLIIASVVYPAVVYFALVLFPRKGSHYEENIHIPIHVEQNPEPEPEVEKQNVQVVDLDKRTFLKLIGSAGLSFFIFSILGQRVGNLLFGTPQNTTAGTAGTLPTGPTGSSGVLPTSGYSVTEIDEGVFSYYGFTNNNGAWIIMKQFNSEASSFRYAKGNANFPTNWENRSKLEYDYFYNLN